MSVYRVSLSNGKVLTIRRLRRNRTFDAKCYKCGVDIKPGDEFGIQQNGFTEIRFCLECLGDPVEE